MEKMLVKVFAHNFLQGISRKHGGKMRKCWFSKAFSIVVRNCLEGVESVFENYSCLC